MTEFVFDHHRIDSLLNMESPMLVADFQKFICAGQWVKKGIPGFAELTTPLHEFMEMDYDKARKRTRQAVKKVHISSMVWGSDQLKAFEDC